MSSFLSTDSNASRPSPGHSSRKRSPSPSPLSHTVSLLNHQALASPRTSRRSLSPFTRDRSNSLESEMNRTGRFVANIGEGLKKMFGKKESKHLHNDREEQQTEDTVHQQAVRSDAQRRMPSGVLAQIREGINLKKQMTSGDLGPARPRPCLSNDRSISYDGSSRFETQVEKSDASEASQLHIVTEGDEFDREVRGSFERDEMDGLSDMELQQKRQMEIEHLNNKIKRVMEDILREQTAQHECLSGFLKESGEGENSQQKEKRKTRFEARNSKSNQALEVMKRKLEKYQHQKKELEEGGELPKRMLEGLRGMKDGIIDGLTRGLGKGASGISGAVNLFRRGMVGSSGNIAAAASASEDQVLGTDLDPEERPAGAAIGGEAADFTVTSNHPSQDQYQPRMHTLILQLQAEVTQLTEHFSVNGNNINELQSHQDHLLESLHRLQSDVKHVEEDRDLLQQRLDLETSQRERLEELHAELDTSVSEMQHKLSQMQERLEHMEYRSDERFSETDEKLGALDNKLCEFKNDQHVESEGSGSTWAWRLLSKCLSFVLALVALISAIVTALEHLIKSLPRAGLATLICSVIFAVVMYRWMQ
ncbi:myosin-1-like [Corticium candelabrum]|uniref:myosin-1-like n=1 Tax=Corticium candelabrum TaxID=121492 RepID=UPI002E27435B|nr:myosin-1-like [Corticium candelabrum]